MRPQSLATENFFYFFLRLRKAEIRRTVQALRARHPDETSEQLARRIIESYTSVSFLGGALLHLPFLLPGVGQALQVLGFVGGAGALTRMHLYLILEIALAYGKDIDDEARVPEMAAVVAATGLAAGAPLALQALDLNPLLTLPASGLAAASVAHLIGEAAIQHYRGEIDRAAPVSAEPCGCPPTKPRSERVEAPMPEIQQPPVIEPPPSPVAETRKPSASESLHSPGVESSKSLSGLPEKGGRKPEPPRKGFGPRAPKLGAKRTPRAS
jgi:hypothetical protein